MFYVLYGVLCARMSFAPNETRKLSNVFKLMKVRLASFIAFSHECHENNESLELTNPVTSVFLKAMTATDCYPLHDSVVLYYCVCVLSSLVFGWCTNVCLRTNIAPGVERLKGKRLKHTSTQQTSTLWSAYLTRSHIPLSISCTTLLFAETNTLSLQSVW